MTDLPVNLLEPLTYVGTRTEPMAAGPRGGSPELVSYLVGTRTLGMQPHAQDHATLEDELPMVWQQLGYRIDNVLAGSSGQATVWQGRTPAGDAMAVRRSPRHTLHEVHRMQVDVLRSLDHPSIVRALEPALEDTYYRWELLEFCTRRSLAAVQVRQSPQARADNEAPLTPLPREAVLPVARQMADALHYLHDTAGFVHADVKPDNILLRDDGTFALADFSSAVSVLHPIGSSDTGRTPQYTPIDHQVTPAWDWAQLGLTLLTLATGNRSPAYTFDQVRYEDLDPMLARLIRGLLVRERELRWGYHQVDRWLRGEDVPLEGTPPSARPRHQGFAVQVWEVTCTSPEEVGETLALRWMQAVRLMQEASPQPENAGETWLEWLGRVLLGAEDARGTELVRLARLRTDTRRRHPDRILMWVVAVLNPGGVPRYWVSPARTVELTQTGLAQIAGDALAALGRGELDDESIQCVLRLYDLRLFNLASASRGFGWLNTLGYEWEAAFEQVNHLLSWAAVDADRSRQGYQRRLRDAGLGEDALFALQRGDWERYARGEDRDYRIEILAPLLLALVDGRYAQELTERAAEEDADYGQTERWFHAIQTRPLARPSESAAAPAGEAPVAPATAEAAPNRLPNVFRRAMDRLLGLLRRR